MDSSLPDETIRQRLLRAQKNEITEYHIYTKLSERTDDPHNRQVLKRIAAEELKHYGVWRGHTGEEIKPDRLKIWFFYWLCRIFGLTFGIKLMEKGEDLAQIEYSEIAGQIADARQILDDEKRHEQEIIDLLDEERLRYMGSMVLGLNDALVELTGSLAGFSFALQNTRLIAVVGLITGIAASMSMAASEYLSKKTDPGEKDPLKAALYTGFAYVLTVIFLIMPYLVLENFMYALALTLFNAVLVIMVFNFYISVARDLDFRKRFLEMCAISLGVAGVSFGIGVLIRLFLGV